MVVHTADNRRTEVRFLDGAPILMGAGVGTQGGLITLSAVDDRSRPSSNLGVPTNK